MATIWGSATGKNADRVNVWIDWNETTIDYQNNRSYVVADFYAQTKPTATSATYDGQGRAWFYVNGNQVDYRYGMIDFRSPARPLNHLGHWEGWVGHDGDGNAHISFSGNFTLSSTYISGGSASGTATLTVIWTPATPATNLRFSQTLFENSLTIMWDAGTNGINNAINGYNLFYRVNNGSDIGIYVGQATSYTFDTSGWARGSVFDFRIMAWTQKGDDPWSVRSSQVRKNRIPNTMGTPVPDKTLCQPGETLTLTFANKGDPDGNLSRIEVAASDSDTILGTAPANATSIQPNTSGMPYGATKSFRVRGVDNFGIPGSWSGLSASVLFGVPMKVAAAQGAINRQVARMLVAATQGPINKQVVGMRVAPAQGAINKKVF